MSVISYERETLSKFYPDAKALIQAHWAEVATFPETRKLSVDEFRYYEIEKQGRIICVTARREGALVGYIVGFLCPDLHASANSMCVTDVFYIAPEFRGIGFHLFKHYEREAKKTGFSMISSRQKLKNGEPLTPDRFYELLGYEPTEKIWYKRL